MIKIYLKFNKFIFVYKIISHSFEIILSNNVKDRTLKDNNYVRIIYWQIMPGFAPIMCFLFAASKSDIAL